MWPTKVNATSGLESLKISSERERKLTIEEFSSIESEKIFELVAAIIRATVQVINAKRHVARGKDVRNG